MESVALRLQQLSQGEQALALARLAEARSQTGRFAPSDLDGLFDDIGLPRPAKVSNVLARLESKNYVARPKSGKGQWRLTPVGLAASNSLVADMDLAVLVAEAAAAHSPLLGDTPHTLIPPSLAPPELLQPLRSFLEAHPFDLNVFGMTRFPDEQDEAEPDPLSDVLDGIRAACASHGLEFHLASDRKIVDDLWSNVAAHMWASRYGVALFEDRRGRGVNYNLTIEVGGMLLSGRRMALLKDESIDRLPTDLVGKIYMSVDFDDLAGTSSAVHTWIREDLALGPCALCAS